MIQVCNKMLDYHGIGYLHGTDKSAVFLAGRSRMKRYVMRKCGNTQFSQLRLEVLSLSLSTYTNVKSVM